MKGAREYNKLIKKGCDFGIIKKINRSLYRYENFIFELGEHARGKTFKIFVVDGSKFDKSYVNYTAINCENLEVYGILGGNNGWTEFYGWKQDGKWKDAFNLLVDDIKKEIDRRLVLQSENDVELQDKEKANVSEKINKFSKLFLEG